ncbi:MAG: thiamine-phosphate kinase [Cyanobacterium sp. T60_A2020_053]|nr:thiamine-phosphate kinase [Cyanobacterium sp. T60_A2020_053]
MTQIKDIGEHQLLKTIKKYCNQDIVGDDGALLPVKSDQNLVITTDMLVEEVHFNQRTSPPYMVGWRSVTANLSDLAAMGALPVGITVALSLPPTTPLHWVESFYQGMKACLDQFNTPIIGGDLTGGSHKVIAITAFGQVKPHQIIARNQAKPGDLIAVTGAHGLARAGLDILLYPEKYPHIDSKIKEKLILAHQQPQPRLDITKILQQYQKSPIAGMDSSDGLADAIIQICQQSQVGAQIKRHLIPPSPEIFHITDEETAWQWILYGGEDFELIICISPSLYDQFTSEINKQITIIGEITEKKEICLISPLNNYPKLFLNQTKTFNHF